MAYTYTNSPSTSDVDEYRFLIGDTGLSTDVDATPASDFILTDEEIEFVISSFNNKNIRLFYLFNGMANKIGREIKRELGPQKEDPTARIEFYKNKALEYKKLMSVSGLSIPAHISKDKIFSTGMHDNGTLPLATEEE